MTNWEQSTDHAALQRDLSTESTPVSTQNTWKATPALGSPEMQLMHWGDTREDRDDDQGAEIFDV